MDNRSEYTGGETPLVVVKCLVFNQKNFVGQMLEGLVNQKTDFPFVAIVHDDCSTDGTQEVIADYARRYPDIIKPMYEEENLWSKPGGVLAAKVNAEVKATGAKYKCLCEGDDYWDCPDKLQKQVDYMEAHPEYSLVYSKVKRYDEGTKAFRDVWGGDSVEVSDLLASNTVPTPSIMIRMNLWIDFLNDVAPDSHDWLMGDYPMWLYMAIKGKVHFINEPLAVYRIQSESACRSKSLRRTFNFRRNFFEISDFMREKFDVKLNDSQVERIELERLNELLVPAFLLGEKSVVEDGKQFFRTHPMGVKERLVLQFPWIGKPLLMWKYRRDKMIID